MPNPQTLFDVQGQTVVITGGSGVLGRAMSIALAKAGARVAVIGRRAEAAGSVAEAIKTQGGQAFALSADVTSPPSLEQALEQVMSTFGPPNILINAAGGNQPGATTSAENSFFNLDTEAINTVFGLNCTGTFFSCKIFGRAMAEQKQGCIINISSMAASRALTRVPAYGAAKAAIDNFTKWLAVYMAQEYSPLIRVNAISPGFFLTEQNRFLLTNAETGAMTPRGQAILNHTPMGRYGAPPDLIGTLLWLASPASAFVTGVVVPVDGGFSAFGGV
jgi:NAD(P)-dependent dehydrogenase (short-subunit alcohol dehydrogenase family)